MTDFDFMPEALSDKELLAHILYSEKASEKIFEKYPNGIKELTTKEWRQLKKEANLTDMQAQVVNSCMELSRRVEEATFPYDVAVSGPEEAIAYLRPRLRDLSVEKFYVLHLNNAKRIIGCDMISSGGKTSTIVDPADVMKKAILKDSCSVILAHNHPSGTLQASKADINITKRISEAGKMLGIQVDDHLIVAGSGYISLRAEGLM